MIAVSDTLKTACNSDSLKYKEFIIVDSTVVEIRGKMSNSCYNEGNIFGTFIFKKLEFTTENDIDYKEKEVAYYKSVNGESFKIGTYIVTEIKDNDSDETVTVTALDYGLKSAIPYVTGLDYASGTITLFDVLMEACSNAGLSLLNTSITNGDFIVDSNQFTNDELIGDIIKAISHISGDFVTINENDEVEFIFVKITEDIELINYIITENDFNIITESGDALITNELEAINDYEDLNDKRDTLPITSIAMQYGENEEVIRRDLNLIAEYGEHWLKIKGNPFAKTVDNQELLIDAIFLKVKGFGYSSFESKYSLKPYMQLGDLIKFKNKNGDKIKSIILRINTDYEDIILSAPSIINALVDYEQSESIATKKQAQIMVDKAISEIVITADKIKLEGYTSINEGFSVDEHGNMIANNGTFTGDIFLSSGNKVIGGDGLLTVLTSNAKISNSQMTSGEFGLIGFELYAYIAIDSIKTRMVFDAYIPENFTIVEARVILNHFPLRVKNDSGVLVNWGYSRKIKIYKSIDEENIYRIYAPGSEFEDVETESYTEIVGALGTDGYTPSIPTDYNHILESTVSEDISEELIVGVNRFKIESSNPKPTLTGTNTQKLVTIAENSGMVSATLNVIGYYNYE